jgi:hypothetical protein
MGNMNVIPDEITGASRGFVENILIVIGSKCTLEELATNLENCEDHGTVQTAFAMSPSMAGPLASPPKNAFVDASGNVQTPVPLNDLDDFDDVQCTDSYVSIMTVRGIKYETQCYAGGPCFKTKEQKTGPGRKDKTLVRDAKPVKTVTVKAWILKFIAKHNPDASAPRKRAKVDEVKKVEDLPKWGDADFL